MGTEIERMRRDALRRGKDIKVQTDATGALVVEETDILLPPPPAAEETTDATKMFREIALGVPTAPSKPVAEEPDTAEEAKPEEPEKAPDPKVCLRCGYIDGAPLSTVTVGDKQEFVRSILGGRPFEKIVELLGGKMKVQMLAPTVAEEMEVVRILRAALEEGKIAETAGAIADQQGRFSIIMRVEAITLDSKRFGNLRFSPTASTTFDEIDAHWKKLAAIVPGQLMAVLWRSTADFDRLISSLAARADDPDFWKGLS